MLGVLGKQKSFCNCNNSEQDIEIEDISFFFESSLC
jgi:hypothetical protein